MIFQHFHFQDLFATATDQLTRIKGEVFTSISTNYDKPTMDRDKEDEVTMGGETTEHDEGGATATNDPGMGDEDPVTGEETGNREATGGAGDTLNNPDETPKSRKDKRSRFDFLNIYDDTGRDKDEALRTLRDSLLDKPYEELSEDRRAKVDDAVELFKQLLLLLQ